MFKKSNFKAIYLMVFVKWEAFKQSRKNNMNAIFIISSYCQLLKEHYNPLYTLNIFLHQPCTMHICLECKPYQFRQFRYSTEDKKVFVHSPMKKNCDLHPHFMDVKTEVQSMTCWGCTISKWQSQDLNAGKVALFLCWTALSCYKK